MRILLTWRWCQFGGVETWMVGLAQALRGLGHECELFFFERGPLEQFLPPGLPVHFGSLEECIRLTDARRFDIVQGSVIDSNLGLTAVRRFGAKLIVHGNGWVNPAWQSSNCDGIVACSNWNAQAQQKLTDLPVQTIRNGIDIGRFPAYAGPVTGPPIVGWVGRAGDLDQKQIDRLAAVAPLLVEGGVRLWIADPDGPGKTPPEISQVLKPLAERWGRIEPDKMAQFYHDIAATGGCILSTSKFEGLSLAYVEAQACGCPIIGPDVRGVNESLDPAGGGVLYEAQTAAAALAKLVLETLADTGKMEWRRQASRQFVEKNCTFEKTAIEFVQAYQAAPYKPGRSARAWRTRFNCSPWLNWQQYLDNRWTAGTRCYAASEGLFIRGQRGMAREMLKESVRLAPTIFVRGRRLRHCLRVMMSN